MLEQLDEHLLYLVELLEDILPEQITGVTPMGFEPVRWYQFQAGSVVVLAIEPSPDGEVVFASVGMRAKMIEISPEGVFTSQQLEGSFECTIHAGGPDLSGVSFWDTLLEIPKDD